MLGDSVVEMVNYVPDELTISRLLEASFTDGSTEVLNFGTAGYCTRAEVELLRVRGLKFEPDHVIVLFVENDYWGYNLEHAVGGAIARPRSIESLFEHSHFFRLAALQFNLFHFADEFNPARWHRDAVGENNVVEGFRLLRELADQHGFDVTVAFWPSFMKDGIKYRYLLPGTEDLVAEHLAWSNSFRTVRLAAHFRRHWESLPDRPQPEWYYTNGDGMHPSPQGCRVAAAALRDVLADPDAATRNSASVSVAPERWRQQLAELHAQTLALEPEDDEPMTHRVGSVLRRQNRWVEATEYQKKLLSEEVASPGNALRGQQDIVAQYHAAGALFMRENEFYAARDVFERIVGLNPEDTEAWYQLGLALRSTNEVKMATMTFKKVLEFDPTHQGALNELRRLEDASAAE